MTLRCWQACALEPEKAICVKWDVRAHSRETRRSSVVRRLAAAPHHTQVLVPPSLWKKYKEKKYGKGGKGGKGWKHLLAF